jgi:diguanylate cyclase (GGDEF)-like protein
VWAIARRWVAPLLVGLVLVMGAVITAAAWDTAQHGEDRYAGQLLDRYTDDVATAIDDRIVRYGEILTDLAYSVGAQTTLTRTDFDRITAGLDTARLPGATGVVYVVPAGSGTVSAVQRRWRAQGEPDLTLTPAPRTDDHEFVVFEHAFDGVDMRGTDLRHSAQATAALRLARISGSFSIGPAYQLLRDQSLPADQRQTSLAMAVPVYTGLGSDAPDVFTGWVAMGIRGQDFLAQTMVDRSQHAIQVSLTDPAAGNLTIASATTGTRADDGLMRARGLNVGHRRLHLTIWPTTDLITAADRGTSRMTLITGTVITLMLAAMTAVLTGSRNRALNQVDQATAALREDITRRQSVETRLRQREEQLEHLATHDPLTGLANRTLFLDHLEQALAADTDLDSNRTCAVLFIDLDGFKHINDTHGHRAGDTVLTTVAARLRRNLRAGDLPARFGGDEFAVLLHGITSSTDSRIAADRLISALREPIDIDDTSVTIGASIGIAHHSTGATADDVIRDADTAMYAAKTGGKNRYAEAT